MKRPRVPPIAFVIGAIAVFRLTLIGRGAMAFLDETQYYRAALALQALRSGHPSDAIVQIASNNARPGLAVLQLIPAALQAIPFAFGVSPSNPYSLLIPVICNAIVSLVTLYVFWCISRLVFDGDDTAAAIATGIYGLLANSNIYVRHLLAVEPALCVGMATLWLALARPPTARLAFTVGTLAAAVVTVYPGYLLFAAIPCVALLGSPAVNWTRRATLLTCISAGGALIVAATEITCRIGGISYFAQANRLAGTIDQGSFDEGWMFLPRYMMRVERGIGGVLIAGSVIYLFLCLLALARTRRLRVLDWLIVPALAGWIFQAVNAVYLHKMVLYGRLIHPWAAFMVWATLDATRRIPWTAVRSAGYATAIAASAISWLMFASEYRALDYPLDALHRLGIDTARVPAAQQRCELRHWYDYQSPAPWNRGTGAPYTTRGDYLLVNFCMGPRIEPPSFDTAPPGRLLYRGRHFETFPAYQFEGFRPEERAALQREPPELRVYSPE